MITKRKGTTATIAEALAAKMRVRDAEAMAASAPTVVKFEIVGEPVGKERARVFSKVTGDGRVVTRAITPDKTRAYEAKVKVLAQIAVNQAKWAWSEHDVFTVLMRIYTTHRKRHPDASNVLKSVEDACNSVLWHDDRDVLDLAVVMRQDAARPRVEVEVRRRRRVARPTTG